MVVKLSTEDKAAYDRDGVVCLRGVISPEWIEKLRVMVDRAVETSNEVGPERGREYTAKDKPGRFYGEIDVWRRESDVGKQAMDFIRNGPCAEITGRIMDAKQCRFLYDQLFMREPGTESRTPWHQDQPYWSISGWQVCSVWIPLEPIDKETGSLEYIGGSHRWSAHSPQKFGTGERYAGNSLPTLPDIDAQRSKGELDILKYGMEVGDALVFQAMIVHGSPGNQHSTARRRAWATRWIGDDIRWINDQEREWGFPIGYDPGLKHGDKLVHEHYFPVCWAADEGEGSGEEAAKAAV
ncbi:PhyH-domain-containing protein [Gonapodya prolifera JEL478]|uniref:PhyH-domain-containing protein n=1 Tax=Gonapodya prolifera (strain JEL478) TaxID=1344416 RepID=A0A139A155_GONPJ|nr:PhyH-domain-containing protein [Gonapodya prolifera JEL478]|eukprot:KXS10506.1 PhyH-domain-containing protein [Gonapodya prolifera JEL478]